jgi:hypothetical protein
MRTSTALAIGIPFLVFFVVFTLGWWVPNAQAWKSCGSTTSFAALRGVWEKPDVLTCVGLHLEQEGR